MSDTESLYQPNAGIVIINDKGQVFAAERKDTKSAWQMPQGGIEEGEDSLEAARRETEEETSIPRDDIELVSLHPEWLNYDFPKKKKADKFVGKTQKWFLFRYKGDEKSISVTKVKHPEFKNWKWMDASELLEEVADFRKDTYAEVFKYFGRHLTAADKK